MSTAHGLPERWWENYFQKAARLPDEYAGVPIRDTDTRTNRLNEFVSTLSNLYRGRSLFVATDSKEALIEVEKQRSAFATLTHLARLPDDSKYLHYNGAPRDKFKFATEALIDLLCLANATVVVCSNHRTGFARLALDFNKYFKAKPSEKKRFLNRA